MKNIILVSFLLTLFSKIVLPSEYYTEDMVIHIPFIKQSIHSNLYRNDYLLKFQNPQLKYTIYYQMISTAVKVFPLELKTFLEIWHLIYLFLFFMAILSLSKLLTREVSVGIILVLLSLVRMPLGGTAIKIIEAELLPRAIGNTLSLWSLYFVLKQKKAVTSLLIFLAFLVHPLSAFYTVCLLIGEIGFKIAKGTSRESGILITLTAIVTFSTLFLLATKDAAWVTIIRQRNSYAFIDSWNMTSWIFLFSLLLPGIFYLYQSKKIDKRLILITKITVATSIMLTFLHLLFAVVFPVPFIISLQLERILFYPALVSLLGIAHLIYVRFRFSKLKYVVYLVIVTAIIVRTFFSTHKYNPGDWLQMQVWVKESTPDHCLFLVPFYSKGFRMESERNITGEYKDGALSFYSADFAKEWNQRRVNFVHWQELDDYDLVNLQDTYRFDFLVEGISSKRSFQKVYANTSYQIYQMPNASCTVNI